MARVRIDFGVEADIATPGEVSDGLRGELAAFEAARLRGVKHMRLPEVVRGTAAGGALNLSQDTGIVCGPEAGYAWSLMRLVVTGLTPGLAPDVVNLTRSGTAGAIMWQFNGNNFGYTFSRLSLTLYPGETLALTSQGPFAAAGQVVLAGELIQVPAELLAKLA